MCWRTKCSTTSSTAATARARATRPRLSCMESVELVAAGSKCSLTSDACWSTFASIADGSISSRIHVDARPIGEGGKAAGHQCVGRSDMRLTPRAKISLLLEVLEHLPGETGASHHGVNVGLAAEVLHLEAPLGQLLDIGQRGPDQVLDAGLPC